MKISKARCWIWKNMQTSGRTGGMIGKASSSASGTACATCNESATVIPKFFTWIIHGTLEHESKDGSGIITRVSFFKSQQRHCLQVPSDFDAGQLNWL